MIAGFTGSRKGMTPAQYASVIRVIRDLKPEEFHHGDCVGADAEAHRIVRDMGGSVIVIHPPIDESWRAKCSGNIELPPKDYLHRNRDIVDVSHYLIAAPVGAQRQRSGTWSTVRYAQRSGKPVMLIWPNGVLSEI